MNILVAHASCVNQYLENVRGFSNNFQVVNAHLEEQQSLIYSKVKHFIRIKSQMSLEEHDLNGYNAANEAAGNIVAAINYLLDSPFLLNCYTITQQDQQMDIDNVSQSPVQQPFFMTWLHDISALHWLFSKQNLVGGTGVKIEFSIIQCEIDNAFAHIHILHEKLYWVLDSLYRAKSEAASIPNAGNFEHLRDLSNLEETLGRLQSLVVIVTDLKKYMFQKFSLVFDEQPNSILMKVDKKPVAMNIRDRKASTRTDMSVKLTNYAYAFTGTMQDPTNSPPIQIEIGLISESQAKIIQASNGSSISSIINTSVIDLPETSSVVISHTNGDAQNLMVTMTEVERLNGRTIFEAKLPNISVIKVERKADGSRVFREKFYFLATLTLSVPYMETPLVAWALSTPVIIRTHSDHIEGSLATISWETYFAQYPFGYPSCLKTHATIDEIRDILKLHFMEWIFPDETHIDEKWLLSDAHLNSLIDMLQEDISIKQRCSKADVHSIPLESFYFENLTGLSFPFWSWFHKTVSILKYKYFKDLWKNGHLLGFVGKEEARDLLCQNMPGIEKNGFWAGNFLIRFSQTQEAEIGVVFVNADNEANIHRLKIDKSKEDSWVTSFKTGLGKKVMADSDTLIDAFYNVYPGTPKWTAFDIKMDSENTQTNISGNVPRYVEDTPIIPLPPANDRQTVAMRKRFFRMNAILQAKQFFLWAKEGFRKLSKV